MWPLLHVTSCVRYFILALQCLHSVGEKEAQAFQLRNEGGTVTVIFQIRNYRHFCTGNVNIN